jgi:hypothetical protein
MTAEKILDWLGLLWPAMPLAFVGLGLLVAAWRVRWQWQHKDEMVALAATITEVWAQPDGGDGGQQRSWWVSARCDYLWQGEAYRGKIVSLTGKAVLSQAAKERLEAAHPPDSMLTLWIHPQRPGEPVAVVPQSGQIMVLAAIGLLFLALAAWFFHSGTF